MVWIRPWHNVYCQIDYSIDNFDRLEDIAYVVYNKREKIRIVTYLGIHKNRALVLV